jgi:cytidylate kinase
MQASRISAIPAVRQKLVALQREIGVRKSVVMDGRDIGSNVFPNADYKFFLTASPEERAERRRKELEEKGEDVSFEEVLADIKKRDYDDSHRSLNPLVRAEDAILLETDGHTIEQSLAKAIKYIQ